MTDQTKRAAEAAPKNNPYTTKYTADPLYDATRKAIRALPKGRCRRLVLFLATNAPALTSEIARVCSIGNVSDAVCTVNPILRQHGVEIAHEFAGMHNQFGELSMQHRWWLVEVEPCQK